MSNHPAPALAVNEADRAALNAIVRAPTSEQRAVMRARIVLASADGTAISRSPPIWASRSRPSSCGAVDTRRWASRGWPRHRVGPAADVLASRSRPGHRPYSRTAARGRHALERSPSCGKRLVMSETTVWRVWQSANLQPHQVETFKFSTDPELVAKVRDVVGLYLAPPERAIVLSVDEKTQIQALDRTAPMLPMKPGQVERHTHDYKRNGTTHLFAALEVATGKVTTQTRARHTAADFWPSCARSSMLIRRASWRSCSTTSAPTRRRPSANGSKPTRGSASTSPRPRVLDEPDRDLVRHPVPSGHPPRQLSLGQGTDRDDQRLHSQWNEGSTPFHWVKTADQILAKAVRKPPAISEFGH